MKGYKIKNKKSGAKGVHLRDIFVSYDEPNYYALFVFFAKVAVAYFFYSFGLAIFSKDKEKNRGKADACHGSLMQYFGKSGDQKGKDPLDAPPKAPLFLRNEIILFLLSVLCIRPSSYL